MQVVQRQRGMVDATAVVGPFTGNFGPVISVADVIVEAQTTRKIAIAISPDSSLALANIHFEYCIILIAVRPASTVVLQRMALRSAKCELQQSLHMEFSHCFVILFVN